MKALRERDGLTGLYHRGYFEERLPIVLKDSHQMPAPLSLLSFAIDGLTPLHSTYRNVQGEVIMRDVAAVIAVELPASGLPIYYDDNYFVIVYPGGDTHTMYNLAETLRDALPSLAGEGVPALTISVGITTYQTGDTIDTLLERSETALNRAKQGGGNRIEIA